MSIKSFSSNLDSLAGLGSMETAGLGGGQAEFPRALRKTLKGPHHWSRVSRGRLIFIGIQPSFVSSESRNWIKGIPC